MVPKNVYILILRICESATLRGKSDLADKIQLGMWPGENPKFPGGPERIIGVLLQGSWEAKEKRWCFTADCESEGNSWSDSWKLAEASRNFLWCLQKVYSLGLT